ncbi:protein kinase [Nonomuraea sp. NBC_01738]|uniref:protein kinase domain-containing protein n=1 Tax=Nonomuraea sp. NBC_01738 TaxID=2976003 RepID=UPI002E14A2D3|nr:protein kinase [Nonomuraea sp. NBC_01738]
MTTGTVGETVEPKTAVLWGFDLVPGYREVRQLGAGHTGRVFLATYQATGAYVAIKYLNATLRRDDEFMARFRADAPLLVAVDDAAVVKLYEYVETGTRAAVVMELVDGVSLRTLLTEHGRTSPEAALALLKGTLQALAAAHEQGVAHRDVKPDNLLVQADGTAKLADFGVVVHAEEPGVPAGSPPYMSPELWTSGTAGVPADLYAAACLLFECVKGRPPFKADDIPSLRDKHLVEPVPLETAPDTLRDLLRRGLAKDPGVRYASARQFAAELEEDARAGYGPDWEQRGRRHLAELATLLALRFPLASTDTNGEPPEAVKERRRLRVPPLPPHLWIAAATVVAVLVGLMLSGGRLPPGPGTFLVPPEESPHEVAQTPPESPAEPRATTRSPNRPTGTRAATRSANPPRSTAPPDDTTPPEPTGRASVTTAPPPTATGPPTSRQPAVARPAVKAASIVTWSGSAGAVQVAASGTGPVRLSVSYTRRDEDGPVRTLHKETTTLTGRTAYTSGVVRDLGAVPCGKRAFFGLVVMTEPAAANGPQVSEVVVEGPPCHSPTTTQSSATGSPATPPAGRTPSAARTPSATGTPSDTPSDTSSEETLRETAAPEETTPVPD